MFRLLAAIIMAAAVLCVPGQAGTVITFDAHPTDYGTPIYDSGFQFDFNSSGWGVFGPGSGACCDVNYNGTPAMFADGDRSGNASIVMTVIGGGTFDVSGLDASVFLTGASGHILMVGQLSGGGTVSTTLTVGPAWASFVLTGFDDLASLTFSDTTSGGFRTAPGLGIDNINTSPATGTPEPASYALLCVGLIALGALARRRRTN